MTVAPSGTAADTSADGPTAMIASPSVTTSMPGWDALPEPSIKVPPVMWMAIIAFPGHADRFGRSLAGARSLASETLSRPLEEHRIATKVRPCGRVVHHRRIVGVGTDPVVEQGLHRLGHEAEEVVLERRRPVGTRARRRGPDRCRRASPSRTTARRAARPGGGVRSGLNSSASSPNTDCVAVDREQIDDDLGALGDVAAGLEVDVLERPPHRHRRRGLEAHRLVRAALHEQPVACGRCRASSGCASSHLKMWWTTRVNAVADVCAPARR